MLSKTIYISGIKENTKIDDIFLVQNKNIAATKNGKPYIVLNLSDKTGAVKARVWDNAEKLSQQFDAGDIVTVKAYSVIYQGEIQLNINNILKIADDDTDITFFLPSSENDPDQSIKELFKLLTASRTLISKNFYKQFLMMNTSYPPSKRRLLLKQYIMII